MQRAGLFELLGNYFVEILNSFSYILCLNQKLSVDRQLWVLFREIFNFVDKPCLVKVNIVLYFALSKGIGKGRHVSKDGEYFMIPGISTNPDPQIGVAIEIRVFVIAPYP